ncbi:VWA domain-containing protein [Brevundimonas sp.]|uniref:vWA domain-containing protein n=1 Tax=Brevundimonas sp. TaxID=1871086 RepID=UPI0027311A09|nr:VWA domain-containing protein [Brevundimonas sp.]MDP1912986.1 VWA domain-containing protein [Brevundimonas sp.]
MSKRPLQRALVGLVSLTLAAPMAPLPVMAQEGRAIDPDKPSDGVVSPAACRVFGFTLPEERNADYAAARSMAPPAVGGARPAYVAPMPPPPPAPPPPPPPTAPPPPVTNAVVVTGSRVTSPQPGIISPPRPADTERYPDATPNPVRRVADEPVSTFSIDVDTASYANVRRFMDEGRAPPADAVRVEELINYFDYGYERPTASTQPFAITTAVTESPWGPGRQIVHVALQGYELPADERRPLNLTFLVDVSGSMDSPDKLALAQKSMNLIIDRLRPQDTAAVTFYAEGAGTRLAPTPGNQKLKLRCAVASLYASGGTAGATGMTNAYQQAEASFARDRVNRILMFTDGDFNVGVTDNLRLEDYVAAKRETGVYLSVYGFGRGNYQDARMQTIAQAGNGTAAYVDDLNEARRLFGPAFDRGAFPIADDVKIQVEFNPARVSEYRLIGYETRLLDEADFNNDRVDAGEVGSGASVTALYEITPVGGPSQMGERHYPANRNGLGVGGGDPYGEVGFVKVRYKLPGERDSQLMQRVVSNAGGARISTQPPESTRWAIAVAAFGQRLRGDPWLGDGFEWDAVLEQAQGARGEDPYGERAEFVQMIRAAQRLPARAAP